MIQFQDIYIPRYLIYLHDKSKASELLVSIY